MLNQVVYGGGLQALHLRTLTPAHLAEYVNRGRWKFFQHIRVIQKFVYRLIRGEITRAMIFMPPQHGKSEYVSGALLQWMLGHDPTIRAALVSYASRLAKKWGRRARDFFQEFGQELFGVNLDPFRKAADNWGFEGYPGGMITQGVGGPLVGEPVDLGIIDDYFKNAEEANSPSRREALWDWYNTVFLTRLSLRAKVLIICTRWHEDDLAGRLLEMSNSGFGEKWEVLNLAALCPEEDEVPEDERHWFFPDPLDRQPGEALCPELHTAEKLQRARETMGEAWFWALFQGRPRPGRGEIVKEEDFRYFEWAELPITYDPWRKQWVYKDPDWTFDHCIQSWDTKYALKDTKTGAWVSGQVWGLLGARAYLLDEERGRWGVENTIARCEALCNKWPIATRKLFEPKASGPYIVERMSTQITGFETWECIGDKELRFRAKEHWFTGNNVFLPEPGTRGFVRPWRAEICAFPRGTYKDRVDAGGQALDFFDQQLTLGSTSDIQTRPREGGIAAKLRALGFGAK